MTHPARHPYFEQVHIAFWPVLWWNLVALQLDFDRLRATHGPDILIDVEVAWWGGVRVRRVYLSGAPERSWQAPLRAASERLDAVFADEKALQILALNWIVMPRRLCGQSITSALPALCDSS